MSTKKPLAAATPEPESKCPACGYCPHCGRRDAAPTYIPWPIYPAPYYQPSWPHYGQWTVTCDANAAALPTFTWNAPAGNTTVAPTYMPHLTG